MKCSPHLKLDLTDAFAPYYHVPETSSPELQVEIQPPKHYGFIPVLAVHLYGVLLILPVLSAVITMSLLPPAYWSFVLPFAAAFCTVLFLPFGMGNSYVSRIVRSFCPEANDPQQGYIVQLTLLPRLRGGLRALLEDADDIGFLCLSEAALVFRGDSVRFVIPWENLSAVQPQNVGIRGLFVYGRRIEVAVNGFPSAAALQFAERSSILLPGSRRRIRRLREELKARVAPAETAPVA